MSEGRGGSVAAANADVLLPLLSSADEQAYLQGPDGQRPLVLQASPRGLARVRHALAVGQGGVAAPDPPSPPRPPGPLRFYMAEAPYGMPGANECLTHWSRAMYSGVMASHPQRTWELNEADFVFPAFETAADLDWPLYSGWGQDENWAVGGHHRCFQALLDEEVLVTVLENSTNLATRLVVFDARGNGQVFRHPEILLAGMDLGRERHRLGMDVPVSPPQPKRNCESLWFGRPCVWACTFDWVGE